MVDHLNALLQKRAEALLGGLGRHRAGGVDERAGWKEVWDTRGAEGDAGCEDGEPGSDARHAAGGDSGGFERDHHLESLFFVAKFFW